MASTENLFGFKEIEVDSGVDTTLIFEEIIRNLKSTCDDDTIYCTSVTAIWAWFR